MRRAHLWQSVEKHPRVAFLSRPLDSDLRERFTEALAAPLFAQEGRFISQSVSLIRRTAMQPTTLSSCLARRRTPEGGAYAPGRFFSSSGKPWNERSIPIHSAYSSKSRFASSISSEVVAGRISAVCGRVRGFMAALGRPYSPGAHRRHSHFPAQGRGQCSLNARRRPALRTRLEEPGRGPRDSRSKRSPPGCPGRAIRDRPRARP